MARVATYFRNCTNTFCDDMFCFIGFSVFLIGDLITKCRVSGGTDKFHARRLPLVASYMTYCLRNQQNQSVKVLSC